MNSTVYSLAISNPPKFYFTRKKLLSFSPLFLGKVSLWFNDQGNKTKYLKTLEKEGIDLARMSSILSGAGAKVKDAFQGLYDFWFDDQGNKTKCLKTLEKEEVNLAHISSVLSGAGANAKNAFQGLYDLWFDDQGEKTEYFNGMQVMR